MHYSVSSYQSLPEEPGIYLYLDKRGTVIYVGKARNLKRRVSSYFVNRADLGEKTRILVSQIAKIRYIIVESEIESLLLEANFIKKYSPRYNIMLKDDKRYPLIEIPKKPYPKVLLVRKVENKESTYFGPFPNAGEAKMVLKLVRRIFPYQAVNNHAKRYCLYYHLHLCPCPPMFTTAQQLTQYKKTIKHLVQFLSGNTKKLLKELEKERDSASKLEDFEQASKAQKQIDAIVRVTAPTHKPFEYEINPNLRSDTREKELKDLQEELAKKGTRIAIPRRIECFDISHVSGTNTVASMVVLQDGEKDTSQYRRFKIRETKEGTPDDFTAMHEVIKRRITHKEWDYPDLLVVDGGKGQVSSAKRALAEAGITIPLVGLAKREEIIITSNLEEIILPKDSGALHMVMKIRDEAHRFAITYHRKLRAKKFLSS